MAKFLSVVLPRLPSREHGHPPLDVAGNRSTAAVHGELQARACILAAAHEDEVESQQVDLKVGRVRSGSARHCRFGKAKEPNGKRSSLIRNECLRLLK